MFDCIRKIRESLDYPGDERCGVALRVAADDFVDGGILSLKNYSQSGRWSCKKDKVGTRVGAPLRGISDPKLSQAKSRKVHTSFIVCDHSSTPHSARLRALRSPHRNASKDLVDDLLTATLNMSSFIETHFNSDRCYIARLWLCLVGIVVEYRMSSRGVHKKRLR